MNTFPLKSLLHKLRNIGTQKNIVDTIHSISRNDLLEVLEAIYTTRNVDSQCMLLSILAAYLLCDGIYADLIVTNKYLYEKVQDILNLRQPLTTTRVLNFIIALLNADERDKQTRRKMLVLQAQNTLRISGCLVTMTNMFTDCMMYQDTWIALCHCLSETCRGCEMNQNYCSHLVPLCLKKCRNGTAGVLELLQSLLQDNISNVQLFLRSDGLTIFTREILQTDTGMLLLNTVVETSPDIWSGLEKCGIMAHLRYFIQRYAESSQVRQWATIIMFRLSSYIEDSNLTVVNKVNPNVTIKNITNASKRNEICADPFTGADDEHVNTMQLFQNVFKEFANWKTFNESNFKKPFLINNFNSGNKIPQTKRQYINVNRKPEKKQEECRFVHNTYVNNIGGFDCFDDGDTNLSFSSILQDVQESTSENNPIRFHAPDSDRNKYQHMNRTITRTQVNTDDTAGQYISNFSDLDEIDRQSFKSFRPTFVSTPKGHKQETNSIIPNSQIFSSFAISFLSKSRTPRSKVDKTYKPKRVKISPIKDINKSTNKSMSARLFSAINDSCTTIVKSVRNIFKTKEKEVSGNEKCETKLANKSACSYSFTNYMRKRDAKVNENNQSSQYDKFSRDNSCNTCDNTAVLKRKLAEDKYLKEAVKKLKLGIYLHGCDFKKISRVMFSNEKYMTPKALYILYRKLIVK